MRVPYPYQVPAIEWALPLDRCPVLMDKRLGKSLIAIRWALAKPAKRVLFVSPKSAIPDLMRDLERDGQNYVLLDGAMDKRTELLEEADGLFGDGRLFCITNPQGITSVGRKGNKSGPSPVGLYPWECVIWDEPVYGLRNPGTLINKVAQQWLSRAKYKMFLSGEIAPEGSRDIFEPMRWLYGQFMGFKNFWRWRDAHFMNFGFEWIEKYGHKQQIKDALRRLAFRMTREEAGVGSDLPPHKERRFCELPPRIRRVYEDATKFYHLAWDQDGVQKIQEARYALETSMWLAQIAGGYLKDNQELDSPHKAQLLLDLLRHEYPHEKVVILFRFNRELGKSAELMEKEWPKHPPYRIIWGHGETADIRVRKQIQQDFNEGPLQYLFIQVKCCMYGLDLSGADVMIRYSLPYSFNEVSQSADRIIHPAKKRILSYVDLVTKDTVDEDVVEAAQDKRLESRFYMDPSLKAKMFNENLQRRLLERIKGAA
jgi:hypothetical protein